MGETVSSIPAVGNIISSVPAVGNRIQRPSSGKNRIQRPSSGEDRIQHPSSGKHRIQHPSSGKHRIQHPSSGTDRIQVSAARKTVSSVPAVGKTASSVPAERKIVSSAPTVERRIKFSKSRGSSSDLPARPRDRLTRSVCTSQDRSRVATPVPSRRNRSRKRKSSPALPDGDTTYHHVSALIRPGHLDLITVPTGWTTPRRPSGFLQRTVIESGEKRHYHPRFHYSTTTRSCQGERTPSIRDEYTEPQPAYPADYLETLIGILRAPELDLPVFKGDPMQYHDIMRAFDDNMERVLNDPSSKLAQLVQLSTGEAARVIQGCTMMHPERGYARARQLLKVRFGDEFIISEL